MGILNNILKTKETDEKPVKAAAKKSVAKAVVEETKPVVRKSSAEPKKMDPDSFRIIYNPLISEKATDLAAGNKFIFLVSVNANKTEIAKKIRNIYGVIPEKINIIAKIGKKVRYGKSFGQRVSFKKAIVTLKQGDKIEVYEGV
jgi:large subunit ribosomal protein L23